MGHNRWARLAVWAVLAGCCSTAAAQGIDDYVACWRFDETGGAVAADQSANRYDAAVHGAAWTTGRIDNALAYDNVGDYVDNGANGLMARLAAQTQGSISAWFRLNTLPAVGTVASIFYLGNGGGSAAESFHLEVGHYGPATQQQLYFTFVKGGHVAQCFDSSGYELIQVNTWYHFVGVVGADYNTGFLNGNEMIGRRYNVGTQPTDHVWFGDLNSPLYCSTGRGILGTQTNWNYFDGQIDEIRLYDGPLGAAEVTRLYAQAFEPGDANFDGIVDLADFGLLKDRFGGPGTWREGDFTGDGMVDLQDFGILKDHFGNTRGPIASVPEPLTALALCLGAMGLVGRRALRPSGKNRDSHLFSILENR